VNLLKRARAAWSFLLTKLNAIGSLLLGFALLYPGVIGELKELAPAWLQPFVPGLAVGWFMLVQYAKMRALKKAEAKGAATEAAKP
jgi:pheromone shutdown protein TraB